MKSVNAHVAASAGASVGSTYRLVRLPVNAKIKRVFLTAAAQGATGAIDLDVAFSDSSSDATNQSLVDGIVQISAS